MTEQCKHTSFTCEQEKISGSEKMIEVIRCTRCGVAFAAFSIETAKVLTAIISKLDSLHR
jgi:heterodisulfide reductase subunit A-like polyferredoxin